MQVPQAKIPDKNSWFIEAQEDIQENMHLDKAPESEDVLAIENITNSLPTPQKETVRELEHKEKQEVLIPEVN